MASDTRALTDLPNRAGRAEAEAVEREVLQAELRSLVQQLETRHAGPGAGAGVDTSRVEPTLGYPLPRPSPQTQRSRLGKMLVDRELITEDELSHALERQQSTGRRLGEALVESGVVSGTDIARVLAEHLGVPFVDLREDSVDIAIARLITQEVAERYEALPVTRWGDQVVVAMTSPENVFALDDLRLLIREPVVAALADADELRLATQRAFQTSEISETVDDATADYASSNVELLDDPAEHLDGSVVRLVNALLDQAIADRASDVHIEPASQNVRIRFRIDGVVQDISEAPLGVHRPLVSRMKVIAGLDISQSRIPQDGRFSITSDSRRVDVRVATIPTTTGEAVTLRLLDAAGGTLDLGMLGLAPREIERFEPAFRASQGGILVTGPTGSGKTSTLYAVLKAVSSKEKNLISVEDPAECAIDGVKQVEVNPRAGLTFPVALRAILRADPDIVMIGEIRDTETARIAAEAAITGHLVFATLHTMSAAAAAMRLVDMGIEPFLVAASLTCVVGQRLVRDLCERCATDDERGTLRLRDLGADELMLADATVRRASGCTSCHHTGYRGRSAIYEIMPVTDEIAHSIVEGMPVSRIEALAVEQGMDVLRVAGLRRVAAGRLSVDEFLRVLS